MNYPDWEEERLNLRHRSSSITGSDWSSHPGYPRPGQHQLPSPTGYPPSSRRPPGPTAMNSASAWDLSSAPSHGFPPMTPTRGMSMQQVRIISLIKRR